MVSQNLSKVLHKKIWFFLSALYLIGMTNFTFGAEYGYFFSKYAQNGIQPNNIIKLTTKHPVSAAGFSISSNNGVSVAIAGIYQVTFRVVTDDVMTVGVAQNGSVLPGSSFASFSNAGTPVGLSAQCIMSLNANDVVSLVNLNQSGNTANTIQILTNNPSIAGIPVEMTLVQLQ